MLTNRRVLIVEGVPELRRYLRSLLEAQGASVEDAASAADVLHRFVEGDFYDLVLLDSQPSGRDGLHGLQQIRALNQDCTIVLLGSTGADARVMAGRRQGADGFLERQYLLPESSNISRVLFTIEEAMEHRAGLVAQRQLQAVKADFYSMVTHDLRNPASAIAISVGMLLNDDASALAPEQRELLSIAESSANTLLSLINNYLDFAKIEAGYLQLNLEDVDLNRLVETGARLVQLQLRVRGQQLTLDLPPEPVIARADGERLKQALDNLLSNAIKYTPEQGAIHVQLRAGDGEAVLRIEDTGIGIPPDQLPVLFNKYHRVRGESTRGIPGTGLGLLIVKEIVEMHGGEVTAESAGPGKGSAFTMVFPLEPQW